MSPRSSPEGEGRPDTRERRKSSLAFTGSRKGHVVTSQRAQLVREINSFFRKRQIKTLFINIVAEHAKSRMSNARTRPWHGHGKCVPEYALQKHFPMCHVMAEFYLYYTRVGVVIFAKLS